MAVSILKRSVWVFLATVGVLVACGLILGQVQGQAQTYLYSTFGWAGIVVTGLVGTPIHELGHFLFCKLFAFQVGEVALFRPIAGRVDGILGFVSYSYDPGSVWQRLGCFFVGIAPMIVGALVIVLILRLLTPEIFRHTTERLSDALNRRDHPAMLPLRLLGAALSGFFGGLIRMRGLGILRGVLCVYLVLSVSTHMTLSPADLKGALPGLGVVVVLCVLFAAITTWAKIDVQRGLAKTAAFLASYLSIGIFFAGLALLLSKLLFAVLPG